MIMALPKGVHNFVHSSCRPVWGKARRIQRNFLARTACVSDGAVAPFIFANEINITSYIYKNIVGYPPPVL